MLKRNGYLVTMPAQHRKAISVDSLKANRVGCACLAVEDSRARCPSRRRISQCTTLKGYGSGSTQYVLTACDCLVESGASNYANHALGDIDGCGLVAPLWGLVHNEVTFPVVPFASPRLPGGVWRFMG
jgi:hypothetical protein